MVAVGILRKIMGGAVALAVAATVALPADALANPKIVVDVATGKVIYHEEAFQRWYPASLTKLMTSYVTFKALKSGRITLETPVVMSKQAAAQKPSKMYFKPGARMTMDTALKIMLVKSANDIAMAIGEAVGGSDDNFVSMMNAEAARLGMFSSHFVNANGMPEPGQYTTARDLAVLTVALRREFPEYASYFALEGFTNGTKKYTNYNLLIGRFDGADGMKTGFICSSGFNQIGSATRGGRTVVAVVLGADSLGGRADQAADLLQMGLTKPSAGSDTLSSLVPYGSTRDQVADIRDSICNPKAAQIRSEGRDEDGKMKLKSPYLHEMDHDPRFVVADLLPPEPGAAKGDGIEQGDGGPKLKRIPIPKPRPSQD